MLHISLCDVAEERLVVFVQAAVLSCEEHVGVVVNSFHVDCFYRVSNLPISHRVVFLTFVLDLIGQSDPFLEVFLLQLCLDCQHALVDPVVLLHSQNPEGFGTLRR